MRPDPTGTGQGATRQPAIRLGLTLCARPSRAGGAAVPGLRGEGCPARIWCAPAGSGGTGAGGGSPPAAWRLGRSSWNGLGHAHR